MTRLLFSSRARRSFILRPAHKAGAIIAPVCGTFLVALMVCVHGGTVRANPNVSDISMRTDLIQAAPFANTLSPIKYSGTQELVSQFAYRSVPSIMGDHADSAPPSRHRRRPFQIAP